MSKAGLYCSFCGKSESEVKHIVEGPGKVGICDECSELVESIMEPYRPRRAAASTSTEAVGVVNIGLDGVARWPNGDPVALTPPTELTDDRLLSCPFCGFPGVLAEETHDTNDPYVYCSNDACGVGGPGFPGGGNTRDEAIAAWNRRAAVGVRALEWMSVGNHFKADRYAITVYAGMANPFKLEGHSPYTGYFPTLDAAKAAAQADYEARIRSCLTPPTPKVTT